MILNDLIKERQSVNNSDAQNSVSEDNNNPYEVNNYSISDLAQLAQLRPSLVDRIANVIADNGWNQKYAANILKIDQPKISQIKNSKTEGFSLERLLKFFVLLGWRVDIKLTK